ncbi:MAG: outer membrane protein assembly factor BamB [Planctomycetota bacterium]|jgi:outer membrane protein assembly factor BamB
MRTLRHLILALCLPALGLAQTPAELQEQREADFAELLTGVVLEGVTTVDGVEGLQPDSYTLTKVEKQKDGRWKFSAVIHYGKRPVPIAVALPVEWAGDTPVIIVKDMAVPFMGSYSAQVMFHGNRYVGMWSGKDHGGTIFGEIVRKDPEVGEEPADEDAPDKQSGGNWPSFRGPEASGVADDSPTPEFWDIEGEENIHWRIPVEGMAHSSPVIWGDRLFVTTAVRAAGDQELTVGLYGSVEPVEDQSEFSLELHCYDKRDGRLLWKRQAFEGVPAVPRHPKGSHAQSTPAVDAERVVAFFGTEGLFAFSHDGEPLWKRDFGLLNSNFFMMKSAQWGFASSPVLHDDRVVVQCDVDDQSFIEVLDATDGKTIWRKDREETSGWSTPTVYVGDERTQVICNGWKHMGSYDWTTGEELWRVAPGGDIPVPTPVVADGLVYLTNSHGSLQPIMAIDATASGVVSFEEEGREFMIWGTQRRGNYMQTPLIYGDLAYFCRDNGLLTCFDARTGDKHYSERIGGGTTGFSASGVAADGKLYFMSEEGDCYVIAAGDQFFEPEPFSLGEECMASPAISSGVLYFRTRGHLLAIGL